MMELSPPPAELFSIDDLVDEEPLLFPETWSSLASSFPSVECTHCNLVYLFVSIDGLLQHVSSETISFQHLSFALLHGHLRRASSSFPHHKLTESLVFHLDLDHDEVPLFYQTSDTDLLLKNHLHILPFVNDIVLPASPSPLHDANTLYFVWVEKETPKKPRLQFDTSDENDYHDEKMVDLSHSQQPRTRKYYTPIDSIPPTTLSEPLRKTWLRRTRKFRSPV